MDTDLEQPQISSNTPADMEWDNVTHTVMMLGLSVAQIESSMSDGDESVNELASSFTTMYGHIQDIEKAASQLTDNANVTSQRDSIETSCKTIASGMQRVIVAMQFYDKLTQRLTHVSNSTLALAELITDTDRPHSQIEWDKLQKFIRAMYTLEEERIMFDAITQGVSIDESLQIYRDKTKAAQDREQDIELF